jgi:hypothetical protein
MAPLSCSSFCVTLIVADRSTHVIEMGARILFALVQSDPWKAPQLDLAISIIHELFKTVVWAFQHGSDEQDHEDDDDLTDTIANIFIYGTAAIWGFSYRILAFCSFNLSASKPNPFIRLPAEQIFLFYHKIATEDSDMLSDLDIDSSVQEIASGIVCIMASLHTIYPEENSMHPREMIHLLVEMVQMPKNLRAFANGISGIQSVLMRTYQTRDKCVFEDVAHVVLDMKFWDFIFEMLHIQQSMIHEDKACQIAAVDILMYLANYVTAEISSDNILVLEMLLNDWVHVRTSAFALLWVLAKDPKKRRMLSTSERIYASLFGEKAFSSDHISTLEGKEWAAGAIFVLMHDVHFLQKVASTNLVDLVTQLEEGCELMRTREAISEIRSETITCDFCWDCGETERTIWKNSEVCTSSTLLFYTIGSLWMVSDHDDFKSFLCKHDVGHVAAALAFYTSETEGKNPIQCPKLRRFCVGFTQSLWGQLKHRNYMTSRFGKHLMEHLFVKMLDSKDYSSKCEAAIGISILAMDWESKYSIAQMDGIAKLSAVLEDDSEDGSDLQYCALQALLNLSQDRTNQVIICNLALGLLAQTVESTKDSEIFSLG